MSDRPADRRKLLALRALIDEMLIEIRDVSTRSTWTPEEREQAERDLQRIMGQVVTATFEGSPQLEAAGWRRNGSFVGHPRSSEPSPGISDKS